MNLISITIKLYFLWLYKFSTQRKPHDSNHQSENLETSRLHSLSIIWMIYNVECFENVYHVTCDGHYIVAHQQNVPGGRREEGGGWRVITKYCSVNLTTHRVTAHKIVFIHHCWTGQGRQPATRVILQPGQDQISGQAEQDFNLRQLLWQLDHMDHTVIFKLYKIPRAQQSGLSPISVPSVTHNYRRVRNWNDHKDICYSILW